MSFYRFTVHLFLATTPLLMSGCSEMFNVFDRAQGPKQLEPINQYMESKYLGTKPPKDSPTLQLLERYYGLADQLTGPKDDSQKGSGATTKPDVADIMERMRKLRDQMAHGLLSIDNFNFQKYSASAALLQRQTATSGDIAVLGLTTAATITAGQQAKTLLAGIAALITGGRVAIDKEVFYDTTLPILLDRMAVLRDAKRKAIEQRLKTEGVDTYPLESALDDIYDYYRAGTLSAAIADISKETANKAGAAATVGDELSNLAKSTTFTLGTNNQFSVTDAKWDDSAKRLTLTLKKTSGSDPAAANIDATQTATASHIRDEMLKNTTGFMAMSAAAQNALLTANFVLVDDTANSGKFFVTKP